MMRKPPEIGAVLRTLRYLVIAVAALLLIPRIVLFSIVNAAERGVTHRLITARGGDEVRAERLLQSLEAYTPGLSAVPARHSLAYAALVSGDYRRAAAVWHIQNSRPEQLPSDVVQRYLEEEITPSQVFRDMIARGYQQNADADLRAGNIARATSSLDGILQLRPADLYAHFLLRQLALQDGRATDAQQHTDALRYFPLDSIAPSADFMIPSVEQILPQLLDEDIWSYAEAQRVVAFVVWQHSRVEETVSLLETLAKRYPNDASWPFYLGEFYHRRQDWQHAEQGYLRVLESNAEYAPAYLRLGMLAEQQSGSATPAEQAARREQAAKWYRQYLLQAPNDPVGLQRLAAVSPGDSDLDAKHLANYQRLKDDRYLVSTLLSVSADTIQLGDNLFRVDDFTSGSIPGTIDAWPWTATATPPNADRGLFTGGLDTLESSGYSSARVDGLWQQVDTGTTRSRAGFRHPELSMPAGATWLISFSYCISAGEGEQRAGIFLTATRDTGFSGEQLLPATRGTWRRVVILLHNRTGQPVRIVPQLHNWSMQSVWFAEMAVRPLNLADDVWQRIPGRLTTWQTP